MTYNIIIKGGSEMLHLVGQFDELKEIFRKRVVIEGKPILVVLLRDKVYAIQDKCSHLGASLTKGTQEENHVKCHAHHAVFDVTNGDVVEKAHVGFIKMPTKKLKTFPTEVKEGNVYVDL